MSKVLVRFQDNWADEMYVEGFDIFETDTWTKITEGIPAGG